MLYFARGSATDRLTAEDLRAGVRAALDRLGPRRRVLAVPPDFTLELEDSTGTVVRLPVSTFGPVRMPIESYIYRRRGRDKSQFPTLSEPVLQTYVAPLAAFAKANAAFKVDALRTVRLVFDRKPVGAILLDDIGVTRLP